MKEPIIFSEDQKYCIEMLAEFSRGYHHLPRVKPCGRGVEVNWHSDLSTFDFDRLTVLVILAHKYGVRIELGNGGPRAVKIMAHKRVSSDDKELCSTGRHPTLDGLTERIKTYKS